MAMVFTLVLAFSSMRMDDSDNGKRRKIDDDNNRHKKKKWRLT